MDRLTELRQKKAEVAALASRFGARNLRVFGSVVRGEDRSDSDVDLLVEFEPGRGLFAQSRLMRELEGLLGFKVDVISENGLRSRVRSHVLQEALPL